MWHSRKDRWIKERAEMVTGTSMYVGLMEGMLYLKLCSASHVLRPPVY